MTALLPILALALGEPGLRLSVDRAFLPDGGAEGVPTIHLAARELPEIEVSLYQVTDPRSALLDDVGQDRDPRTRSPALETALASLVRGLRTSYGAFWNALNPAAQNLGRTLLHRNGPLGATLSRWQAPRPEPVRTGEPLLRSWRLDALEPGWNYADLELGRLEAGLYRAEARSRGRHAQVLVIVSSLALLAQRSAGGTAVLALDASDGHALPGVEVVGRRGSRPTEVLGRTDAAGLLLLRGAVSDSLLAGFLGPMAARVQLPPFPEALGRDPGAAAVLFDRDRYRPGDSVHVWALLRSAVASKVPGSTDRRWAPPAEPDTKVSLLNRQGTALLTQFAKISSLGVATADLLLPEGLLPGTYTVAVTWGEGRSAGDLTVLEAALPEFSAVWQLPDFVPLRQALSASLRVTDRRGDPVAGAAVHWRVERRQDPGVAADESEDRTQAEGPSALVAEEAAVSNATGRVAVRLEPQQLPGALIFHAEVDDSAGRTATADARLSARQLPVWLRLSAERRVVRLGRPLVVAVEASGLDLSPFRGKVFLHALAVRTAPGGEEVRSELQQAWLDTDAHGRATLTLTPSGPGYVEVEANLDGGNRALAQISLFVTDQGGDIPTTPDRLTLLPDRAEYVRGEEARVLILTPFESGTVLLGIDPSAGPAEVVVPVHGYSGLAHIRIPSGGDCWLDAAALVGGNFYRERRLLPASDRSGALLRIAPERAAHSGQRLNLQLSAVNADGRPMPAVVSAVASTRPLRDPRLRLLLPTTRALPRLWASSTVYSELAETGALRRERPLLPFGPTGLEETHSADRDEGASAQLFLDDRGRGTWSLRVPSGIDRIYVSARAVAGTEEFASKTIRIPVAREPWLELRAPRWARAGDLVGADAWPELIPPGAKAPIDLSTNAGAKALSHLALDAAGRMHALVQTRTRQPAVEISAVAATQKLSAKRSVVLLSPGDPEPPADTRALSRALAESLLLVPEGEGQSELACAAVQALGALAAHPVAAERTWLLRESAAAVARLAQLEEFEGGFGAGTGELKRDRAALDGLLALSNLPQSIDGRLIARTRQRIASLAPPAPERAAPPPARVSIPSEVAGASAEDLWAAARLGSVRPALRASVAKQALSLLPTAAPLDAAMLVGTLVALPAISLKGWHPGAVRIAVTRRYESVGRPPWTESLLAEDEEPGDAVFQPATAPLARGAEIRVSLEARLPANSGLQCIRDFPPAGLLPIGRSQDPAGSHELLLCGVPAEGRLEVSYLARAAYAGRFQSPEPSAGLVDLQVPSAAKSWLEVLR